MGTELQSDLYRPLAQREEGPDLWRHHSVATGVLHDVGILWIFQESGQVPAVDATWMRGAELMIIPSVSVGGYPIVAELDDVHIELDQSALR